MTDTAAAIVTALSEGPATARDLSKCIEGVTYANIRQRLRRLAAKGVVTKLRRGLYAVGCDSTPEQEPTRQIVTAPTPYTVEQINAAVLGAWAAFEGMNDPQDERAWA